MAAPKSATDRSALRDEGEEPVPSWVVGVCGVAAVASALFSILMFLNR
jgi:hypothetical protein